MRPTLLAALLCLCGSAPFAFQTAAAPRLVAIGDIHGSFDGLTAILEAAQLANKSGQWTGGSATLIQTGDYTDRGEGVRNVLDLLMRLEKEAGRSGGRAVILMGNHEAMNILHEFRDVSPAVFAAFADGRSDDRRRRAFREYLDVMKKRGATPVAEAEWMSAHPAGFVEYTDALAPAGRYGRWLRDRKVVVNEGGTIFMHAGIAPEQEGSLEDINRTAAREIGDWDRATQSLTRAGLIRPFFTLREIQEAAVAELERLVPMIKEQRPVPDYVSRQFLEQLQWIANIGTSSLLSPNGPLWYRGFAQLPDSDEATIVSVLQRFGATRAVTAHTPILPAKITARFGNRIFLIDTGMLSTHYKGGRPSALEIRGGTVEAIYASGREKLVGVNSKPATPPTALAATGRN
jgi:hypothetical protein